MEATTVTEPTPQAARAAADLARSAKSSTASYWEAVRRYEKARGWK